MKVRVLFYILFFLCFSGCAKQIEDFVNSGPKRPEDSAPPISTSTPSTKAIKYSPGAVNTEGLQVSGKFTITPTRLATKGSQVDAKLSINQNRID